MKIIGIDLATEKGKTGFCIRNKKTRIYILKTDKEIIEKINKTKPDIIAIDSPLSLPKKGLRKAEKELLKLGIKVFPPLMPSMKKLAQRAIKIKRQLKNYKVIEVYPHAVRKILKIKTKKSHRNDAKLCALVGKLYVEKKTKAIGNRKEGQIIIPKCK